MRTTEHQLAEGVCESIAHTTPNFRPPSRGSGLMRAVIAWVIAIAGLLLLAAVLRALRG